MKINHLRLISLLAVALLAVFCEARLSRAGAPAGNVTEISVGAAAVNVSGWDARPIGLGELDAAQGGDGDLRFQPQRDWHFTFTCRLGDRIREALWAVPGIYLGGTPHAPTIRAPYEADFIVRRWLDDVHAEEGRHYTVTGG